VAIPLTYDPILDDSADDIHNVDLTQVHNLSGPVEVEGAEPGDILEGDSHYCCTRAGPQPYITYPPL